MMLIKAVTIVGPKSLMHKMEGLKLKTGKFGKLDYIFSDSLTYGYHTKFYLYENRTMSIFAKYSQFKSFKQAACS